MSEPAFQLDESAFLTTEKPQSRATAVKGKVMEYIPSILVGLLLFSVSTLSSLYRLNFAWEQVDWGKLAITVVIQMVMVFCAKWIGADLRYQKLLSAPIVTNARDRFLSAQEGVDIAIFDAWIDKQNRSRKIVAYTNETRRKIDKMRRKYARLRYLDELHPTKSNQEKMQRLNALIKAQEEHLTEEYIQANIEHLRCRYNMMLTADFLSECESTSNQERYRMMESVEHGRQIIRTLPLTVFLTVLFAAVSFTPEFGTFEPVSMLMDLFNIALNFALGWTIVGTNSITTLVQVYINRAKVLASFKKSQEMLDAVKASGLVE